MISTRMPGDREGKRRQRRRVRQAPFERRDIRELELAGERGAVICNPPYGERLLDQQAAQELYRVMGQKLQRKRGWSYTVISPEEQFEQYFGRMADKRRKLYNGMIKCQVYQYFK